LVSGPPHTAAAAADVLEAVRSGQDLGLLAIELAGSDDSPVAEVSQLRQLVCGTRR
jgi:hypothetical protein